MSTTTTATHRITVVYSEKTIEFTVEQDMAVLTGGGDWQVSQVWQEKAVTADQRRATVAVSAREHGWMLPDGRWPAIRKGHRQVFTQDIWILDHRRVVADVTARRNDLLGQLAVAEDLWRGALLAGSSQGKLSSNDLAAAAGVTSSRVRQLLMAPKVAPRSVSTAALQWKKP